jgi:hypothetical protein
MSCSLKRRSLVTWRRGSERGGGLSHLPKIISAEASGPLRAPTRHRSEQPLEATTPLLYGEALSMEVVEITVDELLKRFRPARF